MTAAPSGAEPDTTETFFGDAVTWRAEAAAALGIDDQDLPAAISPGASFPAVLRTIVGSVPAPRMIVDIGSGVGGDSEFIRRATGARVLAVEPSPLARETARRCFPRLMQVDGDATHTGLTDGCADGVVMCGLLSLIDDPCPVLAEAVRLLSPNGRLAIADLFGSGRSDLRSAPNVFRTPKTVIDLCTAQGLEIVDIAVGEPTPDSHWSAIAARVDAWIEEHCCDRLGYAAWCRDRAHLARHIANGDVLGGCVIAE